MITKKQVEIIDFIKNQIDIDLTSHIKEYFKRKYVFFWTQKLNKNDIIKIERLGFFSKKFKLEQNGCNCLAIVLI